jgi:hypothetical protein
VLPCGLRGTSKLGVRAARREARCAANDLYLSFI